MTELLDGIHPGEVLLEDFMKPLGISARKLSVDIPRYLPALLETGLDAGISQPSAT